MASNLLHLFLAILLVLHLFSTTSAAALSQPKALVIPVTKDTLTQQYIIKINQRTPAVYIPVTVDLRTQLLWVYCDRPYKSSTYRPIQCGSSQCALANSDCHNKDCTVVLQSPFDKMNATGQLTSDVVRINSTDGSNPGKLVSVPNFLFGCGHTPLQGLAKGVKGVAGFGRSKLSLTSQFSSGFGFPKKFAMCLTSNWSTGVIFFGNGPYTLYPAQGDVSRLLSYTPLITNPVSPSDYFIGVSAIKINQTVVPINKALLTIDSKGNGGTKISTLNPYTVMQSSIYQAVTSIFVDQLSKYSMTEVKRVNAVAPFSVCYDSNSLFFTRIGVVVPDIKLVMQSNEVVWTIFGTNSMVQVNNNVLCLGLVDGGINMRTAIVIGGYQMEENLLQFDLERSRLGFSSSLQYMAATTCGNFNFTLV